MKFRIDTEGFDKLDAVRYTIHCPSYECGWKYTYLVTNEALASSSNIDGMCRALLDDYAFFHLAEDHDLWQRNHVMRDVRRALVKQGIYTLADETFFDAR